MPATVRERRSRLFRPRPRSPRDSPSAQPLALSYTRSKRACITRRLSCNAVRHRANAIAHRAGAVRKAAASMRTCRPARLPGRPSQHGPHPDQLADRARVLVALRTPARNASSSCSVVSPVRNPGNQRTAPSRIASARVFASPGSFVPLRFVHDHATARSSIDTSPHRASLHGRGACHPRLGSDDVTPGRYDGRPGVCRPSLIKSYRTAVTRSARTAASAANASPAVGRTESKTREAGQLSSTMLPGRRVMCAPYRRPTMSITSSSRVIGNCACIRFRRAPRCAG